MYAVVKTGGKQYRVTPNEVIRVEFLPVEAGATVELTEVLMMGGESPVIGVPLVAGAKVTATVLEQDKDDKIIVFKKRRRKHYRRRTGHRQMKTVLRIQEIIAA